MQNYNKKRLYANIPPNGYVSDICLCTDCVRCDFSLIFSVFVFVNNEKKFEINEKRFVLDGSKSFLNRPKHTFRRSETKFQTVLTKILLMITKISSLISDIFTDISRRKILKKCLVFGDYVSFIGLSKMKNENKMRKIVV